MISVLLVDGRPEFLARAKGLLERSGQIEVCPAGSGELALELLKAGRFDTIISDYELHGLTGVELLQALRSRRDDTPVILYASQCPGAVSTEALYSGTEFVIRRTSDTEVQISALCCMVREIVRRRETENVLLQRERDFHAIVEKNADAMVVLDDDGVVRYVNPAAVALFSLPEEGLLGKMIGFPIVLNEPVGMYVLRQYREFVAVEMRMVEVEWGGKPSYLISFKDITGHVRYEEELLDAADRLETLVAHRTGELTEINRMLKAEIEVRKRAEEELKKAREQVELYLDLVGHDIHALNEAGIGYLRLALEALGTENMIGRADEFLVRKPLEALETSSRLIDSVRMIQQIRSDECLLKSVDLHVLLLDLQKRYLESTDRDLTFSLSFNYPPDTHFYVRASDLINDVFDNLIDNAIRHSDPEKPLLITLGLKTVEADGKRYYRATVEDNGPGIPDRRKDKIFSRFQGDETRSQGSGLGLYIAKALTEKFNGQVWVEDRVPGDYSKGARFVVLLPVAEP